MSYLILSAIVIAISYYYDRLKQSEKVTKGVNALFYVLICFSLCLFAGLRTRYNDTYAYIEGFSEVTTNFNDIFVGDFSISKVYLFRIWNFLIYNFISKNANVYLFLCSIVFVFPAVRLIQKYSKQFTFSMILFMFAGMYLFSLAGLKQAMATGVILMGLPHLFKKQYVRYYLFCVLSISFHAYSIFFLILPLLGVEIFNKRTVIFCLTIIAIGMLLPYISGAIAAIIEFLGKDVSEETLQTGSVNILRAFVYLVPFVLTILSINNLKTTSIEEKWLIKIGILSTVFMFLSLFGNPILFGRIPQYFLMGTVISMPLLIERTFVKRELSLILFLAIVCYIIFGVYGLYIDGAFSKDIFGLIWL
ncbi:MAG: EpsG family protein [Clostridiales bacterium]|nr:EpsG family protein [Clostridiales bacterium]